MKAETGTRGDDNVARLINCDIVTGSLPVNQPNTLDLPTLNKSLDMKKGRGFNDVWMLSVFSSGVNVFGNLEWSIELHERLLKVLE